MLAIRKSLVASVLCAVASVGFVANVYAAEEKADEKITYNKLRKFNS